MTNKQAKVCKIIQKQKTLGSILPKSKLKDYMELQECFEPNMLYFSDFDMEDDTIVTLSDWLLEQLEDRRRVSFREWFTWILSICALIVSIIALFCS